jgi:Flp pilus assembly protein TadD
MECSNCGAPIRLSAKVCIKCGTYVAAVTVAPIVTQEAPAILDSIPPTVDVAKDPVPLQPVFKPAETVVSPHVVPAFEAASENLYMKGRVVTTNSTENVRVAHATPSFGTLAIGGSAKVILGAVIGVAAIAVFYFVFVNVLSTKQPTNLSTAPRLADTTAPAQPVTIAAPSQAVITSSVTTAATESIQDSNAATPASVSETVPTQTGSAKPQMSKDVLNEILTKATAGDWTVLDDRVRSTRPITYDLGDRKSARELNKYGLDLLTRGDFDKAILELEKASNVSRGDAEIRNNLGFAELKARHFEKATGYFLDTLLIDPTRTSAWANVAEAFAERDKVVASEAALRLSVHFSRNQAKTLDFYSSNLAQLSSDKYRAVVILALPSLASVPQYAR